MKVTCKLLVASLVALGILLSLGFQDPGGPGGPGGISVEYGHWTGNGVPWDEGNCYTATGNPLNPFGFVAKVDTSDHKCDNGVFCVPHASCSPFAGDPAIFAANCNYKKTAKSALVGTCVPVPNATCPTCPQGSSILCMVYKLFETVAPGGACQQPCGQYQLVFGGQCVVLSP